MKHAFLAVIGLALTTSFVPEVQAYPSNWSCSGTCGTMGADGVVTAPPEGSSYDYVTTRGAGSNDGLGLGDETNGSVLTSNVFDAKAGDNLRFYFNFVTSDGAGFSDYAWARLFNLQTNDYTYLLTARTQPSGTIIPGTGLPDIGAVLTPVSVPIIGGGPNWSALGNDSGSCYDSGCGYTGWVRSDYILASEGQYRLEFGVVNWNDTAYNTGLAVSGAQINEEPIGDVPEPASLLLIGGGLAGLLGARRRKPQARG